ncbi:UNVERIFIED_ORG: hypothetical protein J2Y81_007878 [Paraburkholderia sediminicola]|nr:hypothetical protein [Paraburkholderia sediminicola]
MRDLGDTAAVPPSAITVAKLTVDPDALQAFALEQNRLACLLL